VSRSLYVTAQVGDFASPSHLHEPQEALAPIREAGGHIRQLDDPVKSLPGLRGPDVGYLAVQIPLGLLLMGGDTPVNGKHPLRQGEGFPPEAPDFGFGDAALAAGRTKHPDLALPFPAADGVRMDAE